jgi:hypothetical protein
MDPAQRDSLEQESCNQSALHFGDHWMFRIEDKGTATQFADLSHFSALDE